MFGVRAEVLSDWWTLAGWDGSQANQNDARQDIFNPWTNQSSALNLVSGLETVKSGEAGL